MKKIISLACTALAVLLLLSSCAAQDKSTAKRINAASDFEFCLLENVEEHDFGGYGALYGFGVTKYYGKDYELAKDENGYIIEEGEYVSYEVTAWPDESNGGKFVTAIYCTDMDVRVLGLTLENSLDEFSAALSDMGFKVKESEQYGTDGIIKEYTAIKAEKGGISVYICDYGQSKTLSIRADVSNKLGIIY
ncbi:MAG: hypothetical protein E7608_02100 [Ruminococcaceae bacterium]|nr:hypothetical protein [Oscillospiraceae bacterium]